jgi:tripartite-type tricarboxylate transporter receptor subunit TctC
MKLKYLLKVFSILIISTGLATAYPDKPIEKTITFKAGGAADIAGRLSARAAAKILKQPISVVNRLGGGGAIGFDFVGKQKNDGYAIGWLSASILTTTILGQLPYDYKHWDFVCGVTVDATTIAVRADSKYKTLPDLINAAKKNPRTIKIGHAGVGSFTYTVGAALMKNQGANVVFVPVGGRRLASLLSGEVDAISVHPPELMASVRGGKVRMLAISTPVKMAAYPDVPTFKSLGMGLGFYQFRGVFVPKGTPESVIKKISNAYEAASKDKALKDAALQKGFGINFIPYNKFPEYVAEQDALLRKAMASIK